MNLQYIHVNFYVQIEITYAEPTSVDIVLQLKSPQQLFRVETSNVFVMGDKFTRYNLAHSRQWHQLSICYIVYLGVTSGIGVNKIIFGSGTKLIVQSSKSTLDFLFERQWIDWNTFILYGYHNEWLLWHIVS